MGNKTDWNSARAKGIGGSEIASVLGLNPYQTPYALWERKTGRVADPEESKYTQLGHLLEPVVVQLFEQASGLETYGGGNNHFVSADYPFAIGTPDRFVKGREGDAILEIKTTQKAVTRDTIPDSWVCQVQWYMGITRHRRGYIAWLARGIDFDWMEVEFDEELFAEMVAQAGAFWHNHVLADVPPPPLSREDIEKIVGTVSGSRELTEEAARYHWQIQQNAAKIRELETANEELKTAVILEMRDAEQATYMGTKLFSWKQQPRESIDTNRLKSERPDIWEQFKKESTVRVFRVQ